jgi:molybdenum ABC transporter molybdate-binding protein
MEPDEGSWGSDWHVGVRVWVERQGKAVLGEGRLELLEWIDRCHSISEAARQMGISYRHAWVMVQAVNDAAGEPFVTAATGGRHGGGARLTTRGRSALALFRQLQDQLHRSAAQLLPRLLPGSAAGQIHIAAAVSLEEVLGQLVTDYTLRQPEVQARVILGASDELAEQILRGASVDLFLTADAAQLTRLEAAGLVELGAVPFAENSLVALAAADRDVTARKPADLLGANFARIVMAAPSCPLGGYTRAYLEELGLYEKFQSRGILVDHSRAVTAAVQAGQADVGLAYSSATGTAPGCRVLFRARHLPTPIRYVGAVLHRARAPERARDFLAFLASKPAERRFRHCGFLPMRQAVS